MPDNLEDRLLTAAEAARFLGYSEGTVRNKASAGELPFVKLPSGGLRFRLSELEAWTRSHAEDDGVTAIESKSEVA